MPTMTPAQLLAHLIQASTAGLGAWLILHGSVSPTAAGMLSQLVVGAAMMLGAMALHSLRVWVDKHQPALAPIIDPVDSLVTQQVSETETITAIASGNVTIAGGVTTPIAVVPDAAVPVKAVEGAFSGLKGAAT